MGKILDKEKINKIIEEADNNDYLFSLLYICYSNGLRISDCSVGNKKNKINPYISFILDKDKIDVYRNIIATLEDIPNVMINTSYDLYSDIDYKDKKILKVEVFPHNRDEVLYKLSHIFDVKNKIEKPNTIVFFNRLYNFIVSTKVEIETQIVDGMVVCHEYNTLTKDMIKYMELNENIIWRLLYNETFNKFKEEVYDKDPQYKIKEII